MSARVILSVIGLLILVVAAWYAVGRPAAPLVPIRDTIPAPVMGQLDPLAPQNRTSGASVPPDVPGTLLDTGTSTGDVQAKNSEQASADASVDNRTHIQQAAQ